MFSVGLDIHDQRIAICVLSEAGTQVASRGPTWRMATPRCGMGATVYPCMVDSGQFAILAPVSWGELVYPRGPDLL